MKASIIIDKEPVSWHCTNCEGSKCHLFNIKTNSYSLCCECGHITILTEQIDKIRGIKNE